MSDYVYTEDYLFVMWARQTLPYPRGENIHIATCSYGMWGAWTMLSESEKAAWKAYRRQAIAHLGERFIADPQCKEYRVFG